MAISIRPATATDLPAIHTIYTHYVRNSVLTFLVNDPALSAITDKYDATQARGLPFHVACLDNGGSEEVVGYACASAYRGYLLGYAPTVELTLFVHPGHQSNGAGSALLSSILSSLKSETKHLAKDLGGDPQRETCCEGDGHGVMVRNLLAIMAVDTEGKGKGMRLRDWIDVIHLQYALS
ncbi:predicted protein [Uncinocarpus reesii 1704]|uniref:N-acetyltransferase domain-containing protein n=1 Tax=Uncinocarpus reesii (strain UAMH 1704) TaxID=336963 RepID=C4JKV9_UNCRE|nr:uncharacterized protein UREG_00192 [Uncinocarpus reesii 1704]EEP75346.1 predicted protein [Uncinocarpus reesii 1704]